MGSAIKKEVTIGDCRLFLGDCQAVMQELPHVGALVTDPPYGINQGKGMGGHGYGFGGKRTKLARTYENSEWDKTRPAREVFDMMLMQADMHIIWGGNYFTDFLPVSGKWLFWDKVQTMPSYSDGELAWTTLPGVAVKQFTYNGSGLHAKEKNRVHPTQKPVELMRWCLDFLPDDVGTVLDPFVGSGSTLVACAKNGRRGIGIERDEAFFEIACKRVREAYEQPDMFTPKPDKMTQGGFEFDS